MHVPKFIRLLLTRTLGRSAAADRGQGFAAGHDWRRQRRAEVESDRRLTELSERLLSKMPPYAVPSLLCHRFPRIVNCIAEVWTDASRFESYLDSLLVDHRGDRGGFAPAIRAELVRLSFFYAKLKTEPGALARWKEELQ